MAFIMITGGAGYIGSHTGLFFAQKGYKVILIDTKPHTEFNFSWAFLSIQADIASSTIKDICDAYTIDVVIHCAGFIEVAQSCREPLAYYDSNVSRTITFLQTLHHYNVKNIVFSSSAAVYGAPLSVPIHEEHSSNPLSPYGESKYMGEKILRDCVYRLAMRCAIIRYFNVAGGVIGSGLAEKHEPETHLIPLLLDACEKKKPFYLYGTDYDTPDGTCIRDYVHVWDIANLHYKAVTYLKNYEGMMICNGGTGKGFSILSVITEIEKQMGSPIAIITQKRRSGDPALLIADCSRAYNLLGWQACHSSLENIVMTACATRYTDAAGQPLGASDTSASLSF